MELPDERTAAESKETGIDAFSLKGFCSWRNFAMPLLVCGLSLWINLRGITLLETENDLRYIQKVTSIVAKSK